MANKKMDPERVAAARELILAKGIMGMRGNIAKVIEKQFGCTRKTAYATLKRAYEELAEEDLEFKPLRKFQTRQALERIVAKCFEDANAKDTAAPLAIAIRALTELAKIDGLYAPEQVEITSKKVEIEKMTPEEQRQEIAALLAKRDEAGLPALVSSANRKKIAN